MRERESRSESKLWPVCHIYDTVTLYVELLRCMLLGKDIGHGKDGYYLAASDRAAWTDIYAALAKALAKRGVIDSAEVADVDMLRWRRWRRSSGAGRRLCLDRTGGLTSVYRCALQADRGKEIGWSPKYGPEHVLEAADDEVELLLQKIQRESLTSWTEEWDMHCCRTSYL